MSSSSVLTLPSTRQPRRPHAALPVDSRHPYPTTSSLPRLFGKGSPSFGQVIHRNRTCFHNRNPTALFANPPEHQGVFIRVKLRFKVVAGTHRRESLWNCQAPFTVASHDHSGTVPQHANL